MIWILATRGASTKLQASPFTETSIEGVHSLVYKVGIEPVPFSGDDASAGARGTFDRGLHRASGLLFSYHGSVAEELFAITAGIDLIVRYTANGQLRKRTFTDILFAGDAAITISNQNKGTSELIGVPFRVQIPTGNTIANHITDVVDV
jgi:hypothetical protein